MGTAKRYHQMLTAESLSMQAHQLAMIPIMEKQAEMELEVREKAFAQELKQTKQMGLLAQKLQPEPEPIFQPEPVIIPADVTDTKPAKTSYLIYAALAAGAYFFLRKK